MRTDYGYNLNGSITDRTRFSQVTPPFWGLAGEDHFGYSYRELNWKYQNGNPWENNHWDWRYRYNAQGEREQKRLYHGPLADSIVGQPYPWVQYLLGGSKEQLAVWHGQQMTSPFCDTAWRRNVFLYPTEYITNGIGWNGVHEDLTPIITKPDGSKEYRISDHLASLRASLTPGVSTKYYDYDPWGEVLGGGTVARRGFNENEKDRENGLFSLGVRKYEEGRFLSIDPLFEKEAEISPYVYAGNAPLNYVDPDGMQRRGVASVKGMALTVGDGLPEQLSAFGGAQGSGGMIVRMPRIGSGLSVRPSGGGGGVASSGNWIRVGQVSSSVGARGGISQSSGNTIRANNANGKAQEAKFQQQNGGKNGVSIKTNQGARVVDNVKKDQANEIKTGRTPYSSRIQSQVKKDAEILKSNLGDIQGVTWHFYPSPVTGQVGPTLRLLNALQEHGIGVIIHK
ncbi:MAG: RHS repeat-associated core domain-containing protein [Chlorobi bacterium]|nr:RHS repeat-associated core domain-containing protein [Chlorobiota bacterium]